MIKYIVESRRIIKTTDDKAEAMAAMVNDTGYMSRVSIIESEDTRPPDIAGVPIAEITRMTISATTPAPANPGPDGRVTVVDGK